MENTGKILFDNDREPQWFVAVGEQTVGPLTANEVFEKIKTQELSWAHFIWRANQGVWKRICDVATFQAAVPTPPTGPKPTTPQQAVNSSAGTGPSSPASALPVSEKEWFLFYNDTQFGPFSKEEVDRFLKIGKIHGKVHAWKEGLPGWERLETLTSFEMALAENLQVRAAMKAEKSGKTGAPIVEPAPVDKRQSPRRPLIARILMTDDSSEQVRIAICRDISVGGMQVLTDQSPGEVGHRIKINVSRSGPETPEIFKPFVAQGVIVRLLEDGRGFSFRFENLTSEARQAISTYLSEVGQA
jgi:hypothetical protein